MSESLHFDIVEDPSELTAAEDLRTEMEIDLGQEPEAQRPQAIGLGELLRPLCDDPDELLKHRFLCRGGGMLLVGPTGIGKSSFAMQAMILWTLGRNCFG